MNLKFFVPMFILVTFLLAGCTNSSSSNAQNQPDSNSEATQTPTTTYTLSEVNKHASATDCWMVIDGKVYDSTSYVSKHPNEEILQGCGQDATKMYQGERKHYGRKAKTDLPTLQIGILTQ